MPRSGSRARGPAPSGRARRRGARPVDVVGPAAAQRRDERVRPAHRRFGMPVGVDAEEERRAGAVRDPCAGDVPHARAGGSRPRHHDLDAGAAQELAQPQRDVEHEVGLADPRHDAARAAAVLDLPGAEPGPMGSVAGFARASWPGSITTTGRAAAGCRRDGARAQEREHARHERAARGSRRRPHADTHPDERQERSGHEERRRGDHEDLGRRRVELDGQRRDHAEPREDAEREADRPGAHAPEPGAEGSAAGHLGELVDGSLAAHLVRDAPRALPGTARRRGRARPNAGGRRARRRRPPRRPRRGPALNGWSAKSGATTCGTPAASAPRVVPEPP